MNTMIYLTAALMAVWVFVAFYLFLLTSREKKLRLEVQRLKRLFEKASSEKDS
jgi:CcmD family protein